MKELNNWSQQEDLVKLWTKMGASTGSMMGRLIGVGAVMGLQAINSLNAPLVETLQQMRQTVNPESQQNHKTTQILEQQRPNGER